MNTTVAKRFTKARRPKGTNASVHIQIQTLQDLIAAIEREEGERSQLSAMLRALTAHICMSLDRTPDKIGISELADLRPRLRIYLQGRGFKRNSVRSYVNFLRILLERAKHLGWGGHSIEMERLWKPIRDCISRVKGGTGIVRYAIRAHKPPSNFTDGDLDGWAAEQVRLGRGFEYTRNIKTAFRRRISQAGIDNQLPKLTFQFRERYGVPVSKFPDPLRTQLMKVLEWKTAAFVNGRSIKSRHRTVTSMHLQTVIGRLYGFVRTHLGKLVGTLAELLTKENVSSYAEWCFNERGLRPPTLAVWIGMIGALGKHPLFGGKTFDWARDLVAGLPPDIEGRTQQIKAQKWVDYDDLSRAPSRILEDARRMSDPKLKARLVRNALMLWWLLVLPWRQRNLRECRVGASALGGNLFLEEISPIATMAKAKWVEEALKINPHQKFWQFRFGPDETKNGHQVHAILPKQLVGPLEDYLKVHRPLLIDGNDPGTLFLNNRGRVYSKVIIEVTIGRLTARYAGRRVTPHLFRDIYAVKYLEERPEDYLTLSKILWHRNVQTTLRIYGARFDESHGTRRAEEWLDSRESTRIRK